MILDIYRNENIVESVNIAGDGIATYSRSLMNEHQVVMSVESPRVLDILKGDFIRVNGVPFTLNKPVEPTKLSNRQFKYDFTFEGPESAMNRKVFMDEGSATFDYNGATPLEILQLLVENVNEIDPGWTIGSVDEADEQNFTFDNVKCLEALTSIAQQFKMEWFCNNKEIHLLNKVGFDATLEFSYGKGKGLYQLDRKNVQDKNVVTKLYAFGSDKNIDYTYRNGIGKLIFEERFLTKNFNPDYPEEDVQTFDEIYPKREATVTATDNANSITDDSIDFDINNQLISGITAKISFLTGDLAGVTFEIQANGYNPVTKTIKFNSFTSDAGLVYPSPDEDLIPRVGDKYTLLDIKMPQSYIDAAEAELKAKAQQYLDENSVPRVVYELTIDPLHIKRNNIQFNVGDRVTIVDDQLGINDFIRVAAISYPLYFPEKITATIADTIGYDLVQKLIAKDTENDKKITIVDRTNEEKARIATAALKLLKDLIFDPDGYLTDGNAKNLTTETGMLTVGFKSQNFAISGVTVERNFNDDPNKFTISSGILTHRMYEIEGLGNVWVMDHNEYEDLIPDKAYYVYARCSKTQLSGQWMLSTDQHGVDDETGFWNFNLGILYPVIDGSRQFIFTNGMGYMFGDNLICGMISSIDGTQYWDLSQMKEFKGVPGSSWDFNVTNPGQVTIDGALVTKMIFADNAEIINLVVNTLVTTNPTTENPNPQRVEIKKDTNSLKLFAQGEASPVVTIDVQTSGTPGQGGVGGGGIRAGDIDYNASELTTKGIFSNASQQTFLPASAGISTNASVVGMLFKRNGDSIGALTGLSAATVGMDLSTAKDYSAVKYYSYGEVVIYNSTEYVYINSNSEAGILPTNTGYWSQYISPSFGGLFNGMFNWGQFHFPIVRIDGTTVTTYDILKNDYYISLYNSTAMTLNLPLPPKQSGYVSNTGSAGIIRGIGCTYKIRIVNNSQNTAINVYATGTDGSGNQIKINGAVLQGGGASPVDHVNIANWINGDDTNLDFNRQGGLAEFTWNGQAWDYNLTQFITAN